MTPGKNDQPPEAQPADADDEARLGKRRSRWGRMRNRIGFLRTPTKNANQDPRTIGMQGDNPAWGNESYR